MSIASEDDENGGKNVSFGWKSFLTGRLDVAVHDALLVHVPGEKKKKNE